MSIGVGVTKIVMTFYYKVCNCRPRLCCGDGSVG